MNTRSNSSPSRHRVRRICGNLLLIAAAIWIARFVYLRLITPAMTSQSALVKYGPLIRADTSDAATAELAQIANAIPQPPPFKEPPPAGMTWHFENSWAGFELDYTDVLADPWTPAERPYLRACIQYLTDPPVTAQLDRIPPLLDRPLRSDTPAIVLPNTEQSGLPAIRIRRLTKLLAGRARIAFENNDDTAAWRDLRTCLRLAGSYESATYLDLLANTSVELIALEELMRCVHERTLEPALVADISTTIESLPSLTNAWVVASTNETILAQVLVARRFANRPNDAGWLMLSVPRQESGAPRSRLWNLLTFVYNDFSTANARIIAQGEVWRSVASMSQTQGCKTLERLAAHPLLTVADGEPLLEYGSVNGAPLRPLDLMHAARARRMATQISLALNRYRVDHSTYPQNLNQLAPQYLPTVPLDPFSEQLFGYDLSSNGDYRLWSVGPDAIDDGGQPLQDIASRGDLLFPPPRPASLIRLTLEPITTNGAP